ncbi:hypothetical protein PIB30_051931 [Stylosanthes scabra]|uniref:FACT complex subunit n=1 Tax=Stylosanthes scabra TaxID=79078 RepID=A0ABU6TKB8_9FABA|nr:hypothetical protein [Stylosanthes scabra]
MERLLEEWEGLGEIECKDIGPYRCSITFASPEIRDEAMQRRSFEVFVKEFGSEVYSVELHPDLELEMENSGSMEDLKSESVVRETLAENERAPECPTGTNLNVVNVGNPQLDAIIDYKLSIMLAFTPYSNSGDANVGVTRKGMRNIEVHSNDEERSDETLYRINKDVRLGVQSVLDGFDEGNGVDVLECDVHIDEPSHRNNDRMVAIAHTAIIGLDGDGDEGSRKTTTDKLSEGEDYGEADLMMSDETLYRINLDCAVGAQNQCGDGMVKEYDLGVNGDLPEVPSNEDIESEEEDNKIEAARTKEIWGRGGLFFDSSDEQEVRSKLSKQKLEGNKRADLRPKVQRQGRKAPCIQGRSLATRKLMSSTKPKLK